ncbi:cysteinyl-tRNA synthetase [Bacilli bacterium PM5-3]|nr:cysteinyl-tRNA synthetase [Bacilli bacterium PM5-3]MDH6603389.1 cysteinyl-tRNA synthetase [Bacilli bacterium PM5-9]
MKLYNSMTNKKEDFVPIKPNEVSIYICGPTVYNYIHIGNARPMVVFDTLRRLFEYLGYKVMFMSNYTDVDDKIINAAKELGKTEGEVAAKFIEAYENDRKSLNTIMPEYRPRVTEYMDEIIDFIDKLIEKGYAYEVNGDVYFRIDKLDDYGKLSNFDKENLQVGARIEENKDKENPLDFTLWKKTDEGINWKTKYSTGRPGWHTECVVMISTINNGEMIDIHGGGMDLKFPHHENEIAQANGCFNHNIANYWIHNGFINVDDEKMSKSLGNVKWTKDVVAKIGPNVFRLAMMSTHYRAPLNFSEELIESTKKELEKIEQALKQANLQISLGGIQEDGYVDDLMKEYTMYMEDDLNTPNALKVVFDTVKKINQTVRSKEINLKELAQLKNSLEKMLEILGVFIELRKITSEDISIYEKWMDAKANKDFTSADEYRNRLIELGIL